MPGKFIWELPEGVGNLAPSNIELEIQRKDSPNFTEKKTLSDLIESGGDGLPPGGLLNQVMSKNTDADSDYDWNYIEADGGLF